MHLVFLLELPKVGAPFFAALAGRAMIVRPLAYRRHHSPICQFLLRAEQHMSNIWLLVITVIHVTVA
jgi:hypothetical protein